MCLERNPKVIFTSELMFNISVQHHQLWFKKNNINKINQKKLTSSLNSVTISEYHCEYSPPIWLIMRMNSLISTQTECCSFNSVLEVLNQV